MSLCICVPTLAHLFISVYVYAFTHVDPCMRVCMSALVSVCLSLRSYVCICVRMSALVFVRVSLCSYACPCVRMCLPYLYLTSTSSSYTPLSFIFQTDGTSSGYIRREKSIYSFVTSKKEFDLWNDSFWTKRKRKWKKGKRKPSIFALNYFHCGCMCLISPLSVSLLSCGFSYYIFLILVPPLLILLFLFSSLIFLQPS